MSRQPARIERTLWEIAEAVWEEVEKACPDKARALEMSNEILVLLVQRYARNVEIVSGRPGTAAACAEAARRGVRRPPGRGGRPCRPGSGPEDALAPDDPVYPGGSGGVRTRA